MKKNELNNLFYASPFKGEKKMQVAMLGKKNRK